MAKTLAVWYMETAWLKMGTLRNIPFFHKLFNVAYGIRKQEYIAQIMSEKTIENGSFLAHA